MNVLVTAGNTQTPIDRVRCITNIFTGRTGARIAVEAHRRGHAVTLVTSHPRVVAVGGSWIAPGADIKAGAWSAIESRARAAAALAQGRRARTDI